MAAKTKEELLAVTEKEFSKLKAILDEISEKTATEKRDESTSLKDVIGHRAHWIELFLGWYNGGIAGKDVFPSKRIQMESSGEAGHADHRGNN